MYSGLMGQPYAVVSVSGKDAMWNGAPGAVPLRSSPMASAIPLGTAPSPRPDPTRVGM